jgi:hypothetical protein
MNEFWNKLSSYNIFNYLLPGVLFSFITDRFIGYPLLLSDLFYGAFLYYFVGLMISRFGSLVLEPTLKKMKIITFVPYSDFVLVERNDEKLGNLSEVNNMYRTLASMIILLILLRCYKALAHFWNLLNNIDIIFFLVLLLIVFVISYRKQTSYITKRINTLKKNINSKTN